MSFYGLVRLLPRVFTLLLLFLRLSFFLFFSHFLTSQATCDFLLDFLLPLQVIMTTKPAATNGNSNGTDEDEKKRPAPVGLAPGPTCPNATNVNNATGDATATAAAACNRADCVVCTTINLHSPYLADTPDPAVGEFWIRHIDSVFGMRTERQAEEMRSCMETGDRVLDMVRCFVEQQVQILREMRQINRSLDETLERIGAGDTDDEDDVLHNPEVDHTIIHALALLRHGGPMDGEDTQQ